MKLQVNDCLNITEETMETVVHSEHYNGLGLNLHAGGSVGGMFADYSVTAQHSLPQSREDGRSDGHSRGDRASNPVSDRQDGTRHESRHDRNQGSVAHDSRSSNGRSPNDAVNTSNSNNNNNNSNNVSTSNTNHHSNPAGSGSNNGGGGSGGQAQRASSNAGKRNSTDSAGGSQGKRPGRKCGTHLRFADIDAAMLQWMLDMNAYKVPLSDSTIQAKAKQLAQVSRLHIEQNLFITHGTAGFHQRIRSCL